MRKLAILLTVVFVFASIAIPASAEDCITRISAIYDIDEPTGMAYVSDTAGFCDLMPMQLDLGSHEKGSENYWAIWNVLGSAPILPVQLPEGEPASASVRYRLPERDESTYGFKVLSGESANDYLLCEMYDGWNLFFISIHHGEETTEMGWYMVLNKGDMDILNAVGAAWEGI